MGCNSTQGGNKFVHWAPDVLLSNVMEVVSFNWRQSAHCAARYCVPRSSDLNIPLSFNSCSAHSPFRCWRAILCAKLGLTNPRTQKVAPPRKLQDNKSRASLSTRVLSDSQKPSLLSHRLGCFSLVRCPVDYHSPGHLRMALLARASRGHGKSKELLV